MNWNFLADAVLVSSYVMQVLLVFIVLAMFAKLASEMTREDSPIEWWQLIAVRGKDNRNYASSSKLWLNIGAVILTWIMVYIVLQVNWKDRAVEVCALIGTYMLFIAGVESYARHLKSKRGEDDVAVTTETTSVPKLP